MPPTLPAILSPSLLHSLRNNSRIPPGVWYYATAVTLSALNRPDEIPRVFESAIADDSIDQVAGSRSPDSSSPQLSVARRLRESLVKSAAIVGLPKTINALLELRRHTPDHLLDPPMGVSPTGRAIEMASVDSSALLHRGETFFAKVYGKVNARVMGQMDRCGTEDLGLIARLMYGYLLSNTKVLSPAESSFVLLAGLIPQDVSLLCREASCSKDSNPRSR